MVLSPTRSANPRDPTRSTRSRAMLRDPRSHAIRDHGSLHIPVPHPSPLPAAAPAPPWLPPSQPGRAPERSKRHALGPKTLFEPNTVLVPEMYSGARKTKWYLKGSREHQRNHCLEQGLRKGANMTPKGGPKRKK